LSQIYGHKPETQANEKTRKSIYSNNVSDSIKLSQSTLAQDRENNGIEHQITGHKVPQSIPLMNVEVLDSMEINRSKVLELENSISSVKSQLQDLILKINLFEKTENKNGDHSLMLLKTKIYYIQDQYYTHNSYCTNYTNYNKDQYYINYTYYTSNYESQLKNQKNQ